MTELPSGLAPSELSAAVHSFDTSIGVDGPGSRFVLFLSGCPLRCLYCQNPDTWHMRDGHRMTIDEVMAQLRPYRRFLQVAGGGVTVSGGEPLMQPEFVTEFFRRCRELGLHTALDTSGALGDRVDDDLLDVTDLVLLDIKSWDRLLYRTLTTGRLQPTLDLARRLAARGTRMWIRFVLVPGLTDEPDNIDGVADFAATLGSCVDRVEVLPFHRMGAAKYQALGIPFPLAEAEPPTEELLDDVRARFRRHGLTVR